MPEQGASFARFSGATPPQTANPWVGREFRIDVARLTGLVSACATGPNQWEAQTGGLLGNALDLYTADELRRAGYERDAVWPRTEDPRVLPVSSARAMHEVARARALSANAKVEANARIAKTGGAATAVIHGEFFPKEVDVLVADWDRGIELMVSTKAMTGSFSNNLKNRWEEFVGDVRNVRGRFPLASLGVLFMADHSILATPQFVRLLDMLRKLRLSSAYDATGLVLARADGAGRASLLIDQVPADLRLGQFFEALLLVVFERLPVSERAAARGLYGRDILPTAEASVPSEVAGPATNQSDPGPTDVSPLR